MSEPVTCTFVYTPKEFGRAFRHHFRSKLWHFFGLAALLFCLIAGSGLLDQYNAGNFSGSYVISWINVLYFVAYCLFYTGAFFLLFLPFMYLLTLLIFRGSPLCGKTTSFSFSSKGVRMDSPQVQTQFQWEIFTAIREYHNGFMMLMGKSKRQFYWVAKHGFPSPESIERCRDLMRNHSDTFEIR